MNFDNTYIQYWIEVRAMLIKFSLMGGNVYLLQRIFYSILKLTFYEYEM